MLYSYFDSIGFYGPLLLVFINSMYLWYRIKYLISYLLFLLLNSLSNILLKKLIQEPRPYGQIYFNEYDKESVYDKYGMPSGHAQSIGYSTTFMYLVAQSPTILIVSSFIGSLTLYHRLKYRRHTIFQLLMGLLIGFMFAQVSYNNLAKLR